MSTCEMFDPLYGKIKFDDNLIRLVAAPLVQRLRHVRLSNIDSIAFPGISNISRFEHVIGVAYLASSLPPFKLLSQYDRLVLQSSALLHDWAITAFGHLVEEAYAYAGAKFDHEGKLSELVFDENSEEVGGVNRQILGGRSTGLDKWALASVGPRNSRKLLEDITQTIVGKGQFGPIVSGAMDIDNIDNIYRVAFHMGLEFEKKSPISLVESISTIKESTGEPIFFKNSAKLIQDWLIMRERVYDRLMLAEPDFTAKLMIICAVVAAYRANEIVNSDWNLTDQELVFKLRSSGSKECKEIVERWLVGEYWDASDLLWMNGVRPTFSVMNEFNEIASIEFGRKIFSYCIKDKRKRKLSILFDDESSMEYGTTSGQWLLGIASPIRKKFTLFEQEKFVEIAEHFFKTKYIEKAKIDDKEDIDGDAQICLI